MAAPTTYSSIPPSYLANTCVALSTFITLNNIYILTTPSKGLEMLGFAKPSSTSSTSTQDATAAAALDSNTALSEGLLQINAASRIALGLSSIAVWYYKDYRALGWGMMAGVVMSATDGWVCDRLGGTGKWVHWGSAPVSLALGGGLLAIVGI